MNDGLKFILLILFLFGVGFIVGWFWNGSRAQNQMCARMCGNKISYVNNDTCFCGGKTPDPVMSE